jgi:hypothetical protein
MSDYIPVNGRGKYWGWRNKILGMVAVAFAFLAGLILHYFKNNILRGFWVIFTLAFFAE